MPSIPDFIQQIRSSDENIASAAWQNAGVQGSAAVKPLAGLLADSDFEVARNAKRALSTIVRHAGRPGAGKEARAVERELLACLKEPSLITRRQALWLLSEIGSNSAVKPMAELLADPEAREDARCALVRIPGQESLRVLRAALKVAPEDFKFALADALRSRGETVEGYPSRKKMPTKQTSVTRT
jgi:HEAT repeat protein